MEFLRNHPEGRRLDRMLGHFHPRYLVLRRFEFNYFRNLQEDRWLTEDYSIAREFSVPTANRRKLLLPEDNIDLDFVLLRRNQPSAVH